MWFINQANFIAAIDASGLTKAEISKISGVALYHVWNIYRGRYKYSNCCERIAKAINVQISNICDDIDRHCPICNDLIYSYTINLCAKCNKKKRLAEVNQRNRLEREKKAAEKAAKELEERKKKIFIPDYKLGKAVEVVEPPEHIKRTNVRLKKCFG